MIPCPAYISRVGLAACSLFILLAILVIPYAGIQADEALFSAPLFPHISKDLRLPLLPHHVPLMVMTYVGSLKTLLYWPIFRIFGSSPWTLRLPVVLLGAITIFIFFHLAAVSAGARAAAIGVFLLATDPVFLLTDTFDWGPVALEHVFLVTGCWFLYRFGSKAGSDARIWDLGGRIPVLGPGALEQGDFRLGSERSHRRRSAGLLARNQAPIETARDPSGGGGVSMRGAAAGDLQPHPQERHGHGKRSPGPAQRRRQMDPGRERRERLFAVWLY